METNYIYINTALLTSHSSSSSFWLIYVHVCKYSDNHFSILAGNLIRGERWRKVEVVGGRDDGGGGGGGWGGGGGMLALMSSAVLILPKGIDLLFFTRFLNVIPGSTRHFKGASQVGFLTRKHISNVIIAWSDGSAKSWLTSHELV